VLPVGPVVTTLVVLFYFRTRGCGCSGHPAFPAPSAFRGTRFLHNSGALSREIADAFLVESEIRRVGKANRARKRARGWRAHLDRQAWWAPLPTLRNCLKVESEKMNSKLKTPQKAI
jgi:hypothetical protein